MASARAVRKKEKKRDGRRAKGGRSSLLYRQAQMRGLLGGSRPWTILWTVLATRRLLKRLLGDEPEVVYRQVLLPGEAVVISNKDREPRVIGA
jgi:hypothetical protein